MVSNNKCLVCGQRPAVQGGFECGICRDKIAALKRGRKDRDGAFKYVVYRGYIMGLFPTSEEGSYKPRLILQGASRIPKAKVIDLDGYVNGFTREQVKALKAALLHLANLSLGKKA